MSVHLGLWRSGAAARFFASGSDAMGEKWTLGVAMGSTWDAVGGFTSVLRCFPADNALGAEGAALLVPALARMPKLASIKLNCTRGSCVSSGGVALSCVAQHVAFPRFVQRLNEQ